MSAVVVQCPRCASPRVDHVWRTDMARLAMIDQWKCLDSQCGHRWDTTTTYSRLQDAGESGPEPPDGDEEAPRQSNSAVVSDPG